MLKRNKRFTFDDNQIESKDPDISANLLADISGSLDEPRNKSVYESARDFWLIFTYALQFWPLLIFIGLLGLVGAVLTPATAFLFAASVDAFFEIALSEPELTEPGRNSGLEIGAIAGVIVQKLGEILGLHGYSLLIGLVICFGVTGLLSQGVLLTVKWVSFLVSTKAYYSLQRNLYENILDQSINFFYTERVGGLISRIHNDVGLTTAPVAEVLQSVSVRIITLGVLVFVMLQTSASVTIVVLTIGGSAALFPIVVGRQYSRFMSRQQSQQATVIAVIQEALFASRLIKSSATEGLEVDSYWRRALHMFSIQKRIRMFRLIVEHSSMISMIIALAALLAVGGPLLKSGNVSIAEFAAFIYVAREAGNLVAELSKNVISVYGVLGASERIVELLDMKPQIVDGIVKKEEFGEKIELRNVSFGYTDNVVLNNINLTIHRGEFIALVGPSGSGKSTLVDLLLRLQDPSYGQVLMDGEDIKQFTQKHYRKLFGVVGQETILFNDSVLNNITYGSDALENDHLIRATKAADAHEFIDMLPGKYQTLIGDRGERLSGGERQRLAIARALMSNPQILLFDEATSNLDNQSERQVQRSIDELIGTRTAVVVAHRLSTIARADRIYVIGNGRIVESGTHEELKANDNLYARLLMLQENETQSEETGEGTNSGAD